MPRLGWLGAVESLEIGRFGALQRGVGRAIWHPNDPTRPPPQD